MKTIDARRLYRLPWSFSDNIISWLEPTKKCNIYCEGCYSVNNPTSHKTLEQVEADLDVFERYRKTDSVSIAGGDPLTHPEIVEIVRRVARRGLKPIVNTNGFAMTRELMVELKKAGMLGLTFHIDSGQRRKGWTGKSEVELNELRLHYARMAADVGGLSVAFNSTVYEHTMKDVPALMEWATENIDIVQVMVFIAFRFAPTEMDFWVQGERVQLGVLPYGKDRGQRTDIQSWEIFEAIRKSYPDTEPCAYLNGTEEPDAMKWLLTLRVGRPGRILGHIGPKFVELLQVANHLWFDRYLGYVSPALMAAAKAALLFAPMDRGLKVLLNRWARAALREPSLLFKPLHAQSIMIIQPADIMDDGRQSMCDGCPDITVWNGRLVWSCRLEEPMKYGQFVHMVPAKKRIENEAAQAPGATRPPQELETAAA